LNSAGLCPAALAAGLLPDDTPGAKIFAPPSINCNFSENSSPALAGRPGRSQIRPGHLLSDNVSGNFPTVVVPKSKSQADVSAVNQQAQAALSYGVANGTAPAGYFVVGDGVVFGPKQ
jgi:hypothetical protein